MRFPGNIGYYTSPVYHDPPTYRGVSMPSPQRVFLVAVQNEQPEAQEPASLERIHVMVTNPSEQLQFPDPLSVLCALPDLAAWSPKAFLRGLLPAQSRAVRGEIVRNQQGQLYERRGRHLLPLHNLVSGPTGEVIEFISPASGAERSPVWASVEGTEDVDLDEEPDIMPVPAPAKQKQTAWRKLFADPGQLRLVKFSDFRALLADQLSHPERLRESHRLPCYVQVFEVVRPQSMRDLLSRLAEYNVGQLQVLDDAMIGKLGLPGLHPYRLANAAQLERGWLMPGNLVCSLTIVRDPTTALDEEKISHREVQKPLPTEESARADSTGTTLSKAIPQRYLKPWEFQLSREEAEYDANSQIPAGGWLASFLGWLRIWRKKDEFRRWQSLITARNLDDQLWAVRPPAWSVKNPIVRSWAAKTLALAGYDVSTMMREWEIYWRRKGL